MHAILGCNIKVQQCFHLYYSALINGGSDSRDHTLGVRGKEADHLQRMLGGTAAVLGGGAVWNWLQSGLCMEVGQMTVGRH